MRTGGLSWFQPRVSFPETGDAQHCDWAYHGQQ